MRPTVDAIKSVANIASRKDNRDLTALPEIAIHVVRPSPTVTISFPSIPNGIRTAAVAVRSAPNAPITPVIAPASFGFSAAKSRRAITTFVILRTNSSRGFKRGEPIALDKPLNADVSFFNSPHKLCNLTCAVFLASPFT